MNAAQAAPGPASGSPREAVLGLDLGTSSVKVVLTSLAAEVLAQATRAYRVSTPHPGWAESDPEDWRQAVVAGVHDVLEQVNTTSATGVSPACRTGRVAVLGIGLSGQMHGVTVTDDRFQPLRPAILWADSRATDQLERYRQLPPDRLACLRNPLTPGMAGPILGWLTQHEPDTSSATRWALQPKDWVRAWLTGQAAAEPSDASATLLYDIPSDTWAPDIAAELGLDPGTLPRLLPNAGATAGALTPSAAAQLSLIPGTPVAAGGADTAVAALGTGLTQVGDVQLTIGTGAQIITPVGPDAASASTLGYQPPITHLYRTATSTGHYRMAATLNGGLVLSWVRALLDASWDELYAAAAIPVRPDAPLFLPHLNGERTPYMSTSLRGAWTNLAAHHNRADLLRSALEGVAFSVKDALTALDPDTPAPGTLRLAGGGSTAPAWRQMLADVLGADLDAVDVPAASGRGAAMLGAQGAGRIDEAELRRALEPSTQTVARPDPPSTASYGHRYDQFRGHVHQLRPDTDTERSPPPTARGDRTTCHPTRRTTPHPNPQAGCNSHL